MSNKIKGGIKGQGFSQAHSGYILGVLNIELRAYVAQLGLESTHSLSQSIFRHSHGGSHEKVLIFRHRHIFVTHVGLSKQYTADMYGQTHKQTDKPDLLRK